MPRPFSFPPQSRTQQQQSQQRNRSGSPPPQVHRTYFSSSRPPPQRAMSDVRACYHFNPYDWNDARAPAKPLQCIPRKVALAAIAPPVFPHKLQRFQCCLPASYLASFTKLFVGQVARGLTPEEVAHLLTVMTGGCRVVYAERIIKWTNHGRPSGCFHVWVHPGDAETFLQANRTALCVADGFMVARTAAQQSFLEASVAPMAAHQGERKEVPSQLVTVACATSQYSQAARAVFHEPSHGAFPPPPRRCGPRNTQWGYPAMPSPVGL